MKNVLMAFVVLMPGLTLPAQKEPDKPIWPIAGEQHGSHIICKPQMYLGDELNKNYLFLGGIEGAFVVSPFDGELGFVHYTYNYSLEASEAFNEEAVKAIKEGTFKKSGVMNKISINDYKYISLSLRIKVSPNEIISFDGLEKFHDLKSGMMIKKGDTLGRLSYSYKAIREPSISIARSLNSRDADPMTPLGLITTFINPAEWDPLKKRTVVDLKEDFAIFRKSLEEGHPGLYDYITKQELDSLFDKALTDIKEPLNAFEFRNLLSQVTSRIRDHHLYFIKDFDQGKAYLNDQMTLFPIYCGWEEDTLRVTRTIKKYQSYLGRAIERINGVPAIVLKQKVAERRHAGEGNIQSFDDFMFITVWLNILHGFFPSPTMSYSFTFQDGDSINVTGTVLTSKNRDAYKKANGPLLPNMSVYNNKFRRTSCYKMLNDSTAFVDISTFDLSTVARDSIIEFIRQIEKQSVQNLIIDVRYNYGGSSITLADLFALVAQKPFRQAEKQIVNYKSTYPFFEFATNYSKDFNSIFDNFLKLENGEEYYLPADSLPLYFPNDSANFSGNVYVLANEHSSSAASLFAALIYKYHRGLIIGRETGNPYHQMFAENYADVRFPHSGVMLHIPLVKIVFDTLPQDRMPFGRGVIPDHEIPLKFSELVTEADPTLDKALELINAGKKISD